MAKLKKLLPLWIFLGVAVVVGVVVMFLRPSAKNALPQLIVLDSGLWELHPAQEPKLLRAWENEAHGGHAYQIVRNPVSNVRRYAFLFDGDRVLFYDDNEGTVTCLAENLPVDYSKESYLRVLGKDRGHYALIIHADSGRMATVDWCEEKVEIWTATMCSSAGRLWTFELPIALEEVPELEMSDILDGLVSHTRRENGQFCRVRTQPIAGKSEMEGDWGAAPDSVEVEAEKGFWDQFPHHVWGGRDDLYFRTPTGSLYDRGVRYSNWERSGENRSIDRFSGISEEEFLAAEVYEDLLIISTDEGTRVYQYFSNYGWAKFEF